MKHFLIAFAFMISVLPISAHANVFDFDMYSMDYFGLFAGKDYYDGYDDYYQYLNEDYEIYEDYYDQYDAKYDYYNEYQWQDVSIQDDYYANLDYYSSYGLGSQSYHTGFTDYFPGEDYYNAVAW